MVQVLPFQVDSGGSMNAKLVWAQELAQPLTDQEVAALPASVFNASLDGRHAGSCRLAAGWVCCTGPLAPTAPVLLLDALPAGCQPHKS